MCKIDCIDFDPPQSLGKSAVTPLKQLTRLTVVLDDVAEVFALVGPLLFHFFILFTYTFRHRWVFGLPLFVGRATVPC